MLKTYNRTNPVLCSYVRYVGYKNNTDSSYHIFLMFDFSQSITTRFGIVPKILTSFNAAISGGEKTNNNSTINTKYLGSGVQNR